MLKKTLIINGVKRTVIADAEASLAQVLRKQQGLTGTKVGCGRGECGVCAVIMNDKVVNHVSQRLNEFLMKHKLLPLKASVPMKIFIHSNSHG